MQAALLTVEEAWDAIAAALPAAKEEMCALDEAQGRTLARAVHAERDYPPFDRVTHDGIAIAYAALKMGQNSFSIESYAAAGNPVALLSNTHHAIEVGTGAPLPDGCDTVIPYELFSTSGPVASLHTGAVVARGDCLHLRGSDAVQGQLLLAEGQRIGVPEMAVLAGNGVAQVPVFTQPSIGILATGNELVAVDAPIAPYQIRRSNDATLKAALKAQGFGNVFCSWAEDDKDALTHVLKQMIETHDVLLVTGGVSRGAFDFVPGVMEALGVQSIFHGVAQRPGKPLWLGYRDNTVVFGLPGNPNSALTCLVRYALPLLKAMRGEGFTLAPAMPLAAGVKGLERLTLFMPVRVEKGMAVPLMSRSSGDFTGLLGTDGFVALPAGRNFSAGDMVEFFAW